MLTVLVFIAILSLLVLVHELGHFLVAKRMGVLVEEFGFGLPPRIFGRKIGETIYSLNLFPIGGFVKLHGEDETDEKKISSKDDKRAFFTRSVGQRSAVIVAGVLMNVLLAVIAFYGFLTISNFKTEVPLILDYQFFAVNQSNKRAIIITKITPNSPAEKAGIRNFSRVISVNGNEIKSDSDFLTLINEHKGQGVVLQLEDLATMEKYKTEVVPRISPPENEGPLGVAFSREQTAVLSYDSPAQKIFSGITHPTNLLVYSLKIIGKLISISIHEKTAAPVSQAVAGPIGIGSLVGQIIQIPDIKERILQGLNLIGLLSISLAFFNILPIPALDGGRLLFIVIEVVSGRKVKPKIEAIIHQAGFVVLIILIILVTKNDLSRLEFWEKIRSLFP